ncbi:MAG: hypothetical protein ACREF6_09990, partial [Alphaproteobacteria bacterium]
MEQRIERLTKSLELSPEQQRDIRAVYAGIEARAKAMRDQGIEQEEIRRALRTMRENSRKEIAPLLNERQRARYAELARKREENTTRRAQLWVVDGSGELAPVSIGVGISDGSVTEVVRGDLKEGQQVVVGQTKGTVASPSRGLFGF